jgi:hypothetical protein
MAHLVPRGVELPELAAIPAFRLADGLQRRLQRAVRVLGLCEAARHPMLEAQQADDALLRRDIATDAAVAREAFARIEKRLAADAEVAAAAVLEGAPHQHVAERLARRQYCPVFVPGAFDVEAGFPALLADLAPDERLFGGAAGRGFDFGEAQLRVLLPVPVRGQVVEDAPRCRTLGCRGALA